MHSTIWNGASTTVFPTMNQQPDRAAIIRREIQTRTRVDEVHAAVLQAVQVARCEVVDAADYVLLLGLRCLGCRAPLGRFGLRLRLALAFAGRGVRTSNSSTRSDRLSCLSPRFTVADVRASVVDVDLRCSVWSGGRGIHYTSTGTFTRARLDANTQGVLEHKLGDDSLQPDVDAGLLRQVS